MSLFQTIKPKSAAKLMIPSSDDLESKVIETLDYTARMVGATLGPGGKQVIIERQEMNMKPVITKDGVTVIKSLGFDAAANQLILEAARDAAIRTANEAGDGTTTATILSSSIAAFTHKMVKANPKLSPQRIVREMQSLVPAIMNQIKKYSIDAGDHAILEKVATLSANGDVELAKNVLSALDKVGDEGELTIVEIQGGESRYKVDRIHGYAVEKGYEESCRNLANGFINDKSGTIVQQDKPIIILFDGVIHETSMIFDGLQKLSNYCEQNNRKPTNVVIVAHGFSDTFIGDMHVNWNHPQTILKIFPLLTPNVGIKNCQTNFLYDLQAYTGSPIFNVIEKPIIDMDPESLIKNSRVKSFECNRYRSTFIAEEDITAIEARVDELKLQLMNPESQYESYDLKTRISKLTSGIARLEIYAPSAGETREKRDRAEDAWMAIRGAIRSGACPGGGWVLVKLSSDLEVHASRLPNGPKKLAALILSSALLRPVEVLYYNYGYRGKDIEDAILKLQSDENRTFDIMEQKWVPKYELLDSTPAVAEAIRNSISIASLLGSLGGIVAFKRDTEEDKKEADFVRRFEAATDQRSSVT